MELFEAILDVEKGEYTRESVTALRDRLRRAKSGGPFRYPSGDVLCDEILALCDRYLEETAAPADQPDASRVAAYHLESGYAELLYYLPGRKGFQWGPYDFLTRHDYRADIERIRMKYRDLPEAQSQTQ